MDRFSSRHYFFVVLGIIIVSMKTYTTLFSKHGGRDTWIALILGSIFLFLFSTYIIWIGKENRHYNLYHIYCGALGKFLGSLLMFFFLITVFLTLLECASVEASAMHTNMLQETPTWAFLVFLVPYGVYAVNKGDTAVMVTTIISITLIILAGINLSILTQKYKDFKYLFPILENGINRPFLIATLKTIGSYGCFMITIPYLTKMQDTKKILKHNALTLLFAFQIMLVAMIGTLTTFDIENLNRISYPKLLQTQLVSHFGFLEFGELYVMLQIVGGWTLKYTLTLFALMILLKDMKIDSKYTIYIISALAFILSFFASRNLFTLFYLLNYYIYISLINFVIIPLIVFTLFHFKNKQKKHLHKPLKSSTKKG